MRAIHANVVYVATCLRANVLKASQLLIFTCQHANVPINMSTCQIRANFSTLPAERLANFPTIFQKNQKIVHKMTFRHQVIKTLSTFGVA